MQLQSGVKLAYSETSDVDPLRKGHCITNLSTVYVDNSWDPKIPFPYSNNTMWTSKRGQPLYKGQSLCIYIVPNVSFVRRFHCTCNQYNKH